MSLFIYGWLSSARFVIGALHGVRSALTKKVSGRTKWRFYSVAISSQIVSHLCRR